VEAVTGISVEEAQAILDSHDLIAIGARADEERRRRHGGRTTFARVLEIHADAVPTALPSASDAGEVRMTGTPASLEGAVESVTRGCALAHRTPLSAFNLADLWDLGGGAMDGFRDVLAALRRAGLRAIAEVPIDRLTDPATMIRAARDAGIAIRRLTVHELATDRRVELVHRARGIQSDVGGLRAFAPLPRVMSVAVPSTGYDDVKQIAIARLLVDNIDSIQVDWTLYGPKLAQVALTMGADDIDGVSPLEGDLGRRRSPMEEIRGNIRAAGLEPVERDGTYAERD
jgi:aminodeoxyfutalosine synthase